MRRFAERRSELAAEVRPREAGGRSQVIHAQWLEVPGVGQIPGAQQVAGGRDEGHARQYRRAGRRGWRTGALATGACRVLGLSRVNRL